MYFYGMGVSYRLRRRHTCSKGLEPQRASSCQGRQCWVGAAASKLVPREAVLGWSRSAQARAKGGSAGLEPLHARNLVPREAVLGWSRSAQSCGKGGSAGLVTSWLKGGCERGRCW